MSLTVPKAVAADQRRKRGSAVERQRRLLVMRKGLEFENRHELPSHTLIGKIRQRVSEWKGHHYSIQHDDLMGKPSSGWFFFGNKSPFAGLLFADKLWAVFFFVSQISVCSRLLSTSFQCKPAFWCNRQFTISTLFPRPAKFEGLKVEVGAGPGRTFPQKSADPTFQLTGQQLKEIIFCPLCSFVNGGPTRVQWHGAADALWGSIIATHKKTKSSESHKTLLYQGSSSRSSESEE